MVLVRENVANQIEGIKKMRAVLVTKTGQRIETEIKNAGVGAVIRYDTRKNPHTRVFNYVSQQHFSHLKPPEFHETDVDYIPEEGLPDDVFSEYFKNILEK